MGRVITIGYNVVLIPLQVWSLITLPLAFTGMLHDITRWDGLLGDLPNYWTEHLRQSLPNLPFVASLSPLTINLAYVLFALGGLAWLYWTGAYLQARRLRAFAGESPLAAVEPEGTGGVGTAAAVAGPVVGIGAVAMGATMAALSLTVAPLLIGLGAWLGLSALGGVGLAAEMSEAEAREKHALEQTALIRAKHRQSIEASIGRYRQRENRKLVIGASIAAIIIIINFLGPYLYDLIW